MWNWKLIESADASEFSSWDISLKFLPVQLVSDLPDIFIQSHAHLNLLVHPVSWKWEKKYYILMWKLTLDSDHDSLPQVHLKETEKVLSFWLKWKKEIMHIFISWFLFPVEYIYVETKKWKHL